MNWLKDYNEIKPRGACVIRVCIMVVTLCTGVGD